MIRYSEAFGETTNATVLRYGWVIMITYIWFFG